MQASKDRLKVVAAFAAVYIIWGTTYAAIRIAVETLPPFLMAGVRFIMAGSLMYGLLRLRGVGAPRRSDWKPAIIVGAFLLLGGNGLLTWAEQEVPSTIAALVIATVPLWMVLFDWLIFGGLRPTRRITLGLLMGLAGILLLLGPDQLAGTAPFSLLSLGILFMSPILWSLGSLYSRKVVWPHGVFMATAMQMLAGGVLLAIAGLAMGEWQEFEPAEVSAQSVWALLYLVVFGAIVGYSAYIWLLKYEQPARVSTYTYVNPVIAALLGWLLLGEQMSPLMFVAMIVIVGAVVLIVSGRESGAPPVPAGAVALQPGPDER